MIPSRDTAHLVQDPAGNWIVVGTPKPAEGVPPPPLNSQLPDEAPPAPPLPPAPHVVDPRELSVRLPGRPAPMNPAMPLAGPGAEMPQAVPVPQTVPFPQAVPVPVAPPAVPALDPSQVAPQAAPLDATAPHLPAAVALPGPAPDAVAQLPVVAPIPGAPA
jgi:hypothetical protein